MADLNISSTHLALGGAAILAALVAGAVWYGEHSKKMRLYIDAAADCENGRGAGKLLTLDRLYGETARPKQFRMDFSLCAFDASLDRLREAQRLRGLLDD